MRSIGHMSKSIQHSVQRNTMDFVSTNLMRLGVFLSFNFLSSLPGLNILNCTDQWIRQAWLVVHPSAYDINPKTRVNFQSVNYLFVCLWKNTYSFRFLWPCLHWPYWANFTFRVFVLCSFVLFFFSLALNQYFFG